MKLKFTINPSIPIDKIINSMQLDSGQTIAELHVDNYSVTLEVHGEVRVLFNPDPHGNASDGDVYTCASQFPDELMKIFAEGIDYAEMKNIFVDDNNWLEVFLEKDGSFVNSYVRDTPDTLDPEEIFSELWNCYKANKEELEKKRGEPGTLIHATLRNIDLIPAFTKEFFRLNPVRYREYMNKETRKNLLAALCDLACDISNDWWESEEATEECNDLQDVLNEYAPAGHYFGTHPGDGSDFGFWPNE